jgi:hypothetical protein
MRMRYWNYGAMTKRVSPNLRWGGRAVNETASRAAVPRRSTLALDRGAHACAWRWLWQSSIIWRFLFGTP